MADTHHDVPAMNFDVQKWWKDVCSFCRPFWCTKHINMWNAKVYLNGNALQQSSEAAETHLNEKVGMNTA